VLTSSSVDEPPPGRRHRCRRGDYTVRHDGDVAIILSCVCVCVCVCVSLGGGHPVPQYNPWAAGTQFHSIIALTSNSVVVLTSSIDSMIDSGLVEKPFDSSPRRVIYPEWRRAPSTTV